MDQDMIEVWRKAYSIELFDFKCSIDAEKFDCAISRIKLNFKPWTVEIEK